MDETQPIPVTPPFPGDQRPDFGAPESSEATRPISVERPAAEEDRKFGNLESGQGASPTSETSKPAAAGPSWLFTPPPPPNWPDREGWRIGRTDEGKVGRLQGGKRLATEIHRSEARTPPLISAPTALVGPDAGATRPVPAVSLYNPITGVGSPNPAAAWPVEPPALHSEKRSSGVNVKPRRDVVPQRALPEEMDSGRETGSSASSTTMRKADALLPFHTRLQRALTLFVLGAAVLMAIGTVAMAVRIYQPDLDLRMVFPLSSFSKGPVGTTGEAGDPARFTAQGTPLGEQLQEMLDLGAPGGRQESIGGPTIEPGSSIQLTIEPLRDGETVETQLTSQPTDIQQDTSESTPAGQPTQGILTTPEPNPVEQPTQRPQPLEPTSLPTEIPPTPDPTTAPGFDPNEVLAEIGFIEKGSSTTGEQTVTVSVYNYGTQAFQVTTSDVALVPPGDGSLEPLASSPGLPVQVNPGQTVEVIFTFPIPASGTGTFKLFIVEFDLGDF